MKNELEQNLYWLLIRASIPAKQAFMRAGELFGLTHMQLFTLCLADKDGETSMHSLTDMLGCDASNVTGLVDKLVGNGFIERYESPRDRRIKLIKLTAKGRRTREHIMGELASAKLATFTDMTDEELQTLAGLLAKAVANCSCHCKKD